MRQLRSIRVKNAILAPQKSLTLICSHTYSSLCHGDRVRNSVDWLHPLPDKSAEIPSETPSLSRFGLLDSLLIGV
jgi:hypothetical protein